MEAGRDMLGRGVAIAFPCVPSRGTETERSSLDETIRIFDVRRIKHGPPLMGGFVIDKVSFVFMMQMA